MIYDRMNSILEQSSIDEMDSLFESIIYDLENIDVEVPLRKGITESMLNRHNIMKGSIMYPLFEQEDFDTSNAQDVDYEEVDDGKDNSSKSSSNESGPKINTNKDSFFKRITNVMKSIIDKIIQWVKKAIMFLSEKLFNNDKFLKEHQKELEEAIKKNPKINCKMPSISLTSIDNGNKYYNEKSTVTGCLEYGVNHVIKMHKEGKKASIFERLCNIYSLGKGNDMYSVKQSVRESFLDKNKGKDVTLNLSDSRTLLENYGRGYLEELKKSMNAYKKSQVAIGDISKKLFSDLKDPNNVQAGLRIAVNISVVIMKEKFNIFRQGIGEHERILKSAILKNSKSEK